MVMDKIKGDSRFYRFKQKIVTRFDRADKVWSCHVDYDVKDNKHHRSVDMGRQIDRKDN